MRIITTQQDSRNPSPTGFEVKLKSLWNDYGIHNIIAWMQLEECAFLCSERETHFLNENVEDVRQAIV